MTMTVRQAVARLQDHVRGQVVGQPALIERLFIALLADGHLLLEGPPGLAKTRAIKTLAAGIGGSFHRVQFTPDLLPADLTGSDVYRPETGTFQFSQGPIFHNLLLADEINRAPAKVQSALLEAMEERQVTVGAHSYPLKGLFLVMATQNPLEHEGTYPLPEAQLDRFLLHVRVDYPDKVSARKILSIARREALANYTKTEVARPAQIAEAQILAARQKVMSLHLAEPLEHYIVEIVEATRRPQTYGADLSGWVRWGASPRGAIAIERAARARAWLNDRDFVTPEDIQQVAPDALRHRIILDYEAVAEGGTPDACVAELLTRVPSP